LDAAALRGFVKGVDVSSDEMQLLLAIMRGLGIFDRFHSNFAFVFRVQMLHPCSGKYLWLAS
jgi:hypothetical protein